MSCPLFASPSPYPDPHLELLARQLCHSHHELGGSHLLQGFWNRTKMAAWKKLPKNHLRIFIPWWTTESYGEVLFRPTIWVLWTTPQRCCQTDLAVRGILMKHGHGTSDVQNDIEWSWGKFHLHDCIKSTFSHLHLFWRKCSGICGQTCDTMWLCMYCMYCEQVRRWIKLFRWPMTTKQHFHSSYDQHFVQAHPKNRLSSLTGVANRSNRMMGSLYLD